MNEVKKKFFISKIIERMSQFYWVAMKKLLLPGI